MGQVNCCKAIPLPGNERQDEISGSSKKLETNQYKKSQKKSNKEREDNFAENHNTLMNTRLSPELTSLVVDETSPPAQKDDLRESIVKLQKIVRGKQARETYKKSIQPVLFQSQMEIINKQNLVYSSLKEAEDKVTNKPYNKEGWKQFYPDEKDFFEYDYGDVRETKVVVVPQTKDSLIEEVAYYTGQINKSNKKHGYGILSNQQIKYEGFWRNDEFTGWGRETTVNGNVLEGKFINGRLNGKGKLLNDKGEEFIGEFNEGKKIGKGKECTDQFVYEGEYLNNAMNGIGSITFVEEKNKYTGEFENNELTGHGVYEWESGEKYEGLLLKGNYHGKGKFTWPDGQVYEGDYVNGIKEGQGKMIYPNGNIYEGPYVNGNPHGKGKYTKKGKTLNVEFYLGAFVKVIK